MTDKENLGLKKEKLPMNCEPLLEAWQFMNTLHVQTPLRDNHNPGKTEQQPFE